ncbi:epithelial cell-transforming sequence 2 oncogene-like [Octodon degus]|uniref:Epithelial cell-transforming sequence 2 oncogene-like n=1 Tax=Octodon degus TaxID=10160 RepID=A0A6P3F3H8_OCTDE|nr:epithelial cell-transforming sequence 2 oncogene-like [Octodon degus]
MSGGNSSRKSLEMDSFHRRFSAWTPFSNMPLNRQLFQERVALISHWFDLWTNKQRQEFLVTIFLRCTKSQLRFVQDWFSEKKQVARVDFSTVLPRFISLYIFSFLNPKDLCAAAQVSWPWRFLTEQDSLPGNLNSKLVVKDSDFSAGTAIFQEFAKMTNTKVKILFVPCRSNISGSHSYPSLSKKNWHGVHKKDDSSSCTLQPHFILISSRVPAYELVVDSVQAGVLSVVYEHSGTTLDGLLHLTERALAGRKARSVGIFSEGDSREINLLQGYKIGIKNLLRPEVRDFWEKLGSHVATEEEGGHVDLFVPLGASEAGVEALAQLTRLTGTLFTAPAGIATGSYQHVLSEWLGPPGDRAPPLVYFSEPKLQSWAHWAEVLEDTLKSVRKELGYLSEELHKHIIARADKPLEFLSDFLLKKSKKSQYCEGNALPTQGDPKGTLGLFRKKRNVIPDDSQETKSSLSAHEVHTERLAVLERQLQRGSGEQRSAVARELLRSERKYVRLLAAVRDAYAAPLSAALAANRAILSAANIQIIFADILRILNLNRQLLDNLGERLQEWGPAHCVGDIFMKFGSQLNIYTNFFNNYPVVLRTIEKCRERTPAFRAFLQGCDKTIATSMLSLPELLLCPSRRFEEYVSLLYALRLHTPAEHAGRGVLTAAIDQIKDYKAYLDQIKENVHMKEQLSHIQRLIRGCPTLSEVNRHLIRVQNVVQLRCPDEEICFSSRLYEQVCDLTLFLFNDALLISSRGTSHIPFERTSKTTYQFTASVALHRLLIEDIPDSKYVKNAFILQGPKHEWICATEAEDDKFLWLSALQIAVRSSMDK